MNNRLISIVCGSALIVATSGVVFAADMAVKAPPPPPPAVWDWSGFYIGVGGSFNWTHFDQSLQGVSGTINVSTGPVLVAQGQEGGPFFDFNRNKSGFAPDVQLGYMVPFAGGDWLAGLKFTYKYANIDSKREREHSADGDRHHTVGPQAPDHRTYHRVRAGPSGNQSQASACAYSHHRPRVRQRHVICRRRSGPVRRRDEFYQWDTLCHVERGHSPPACRSPY